MRFDAWRGHRAASGGGAGVRRYQEAASIQLLPSPVLGLPSTSSTVTLLLFILARLAVVAKTCGFSIASATPRHTNFCMRPTRKEAIRAGGTEHGVLDAGVKRSSCTCLEPSDKYGLSSMSAIRT